MASASKEKRFRLVCFDLDGTIIDNITNFWKFICEEHGCDMARKQKARDSYFNNLITYDEWVEHDVNLWKEAGVTRRKMMESTKKLSLVPGAVEALKELKKRGIKLGIISESMDIALELISNHAELFDEIFINRLLFDKEGKILLSRRYQTGYEDGNYGLPSGHVDGGETIRDALTREVFEEVGVRIDKNNLEIICKNSYANLCKFGGIVKLKLEFLNDYLISNN